MNIPELKKAMERLQRALDKDIYAIGDSKYDAMKVVLSTCQLLCDVSDKMLPKKEESIKSLFPREIWGYNEARSEDILWLTKKMMGLEGFLKKLFDTKNNKMSAPNIYDATFEKDLANAIRQEMEVGNEVV